MAKIHFIKKIATTFLDHFAETKTVCQWYDNAFYSVLKDKDHSVEWKEAEKARISRERLAYVDSRAAELSGLITEIIADERAIVTARLSVNAPTIEQMNTLSVIKDSPNFTQEELDALAVQFKGVYVLEKALSEIAETNSLKYAFTPLDRQLKKIDALAESLEFAYRYSGEPCDMSWGGVYVAGGEGIPYPAQRLISDVDKEIEAYEKDRFVEAVAVDEPEPSLETLKQLAIDNPDSAADIYEFISMNKSNLSSEIFKAGMKDFIKKIMKSGN